MTIEYLDRMKKLFESNRLVGRKWLERSSSQFVPVLCFQFNGKLERRENYEAGRDPARGSAVIKIERGIPRIFEVASLSRSF